METNGAGFRAVFVLKIAPYFVLELLIRQLSGGIMKKLLLFLVCLLPLALAAGSSAFEPIQMGTENSEDATCLWLRADLGSASDILPLKTREWATKDSVAGGAAIKFTFLPGSMGIASMEYKNLPKGSAGLTFYAKASEPVSLKVCETADCSLTKEWKKFDIPWEKFGAAPDNPKLPWQLKFGVKYPVESKIVLWLDRIGFESPVFDNSPKIDLQAGADPVISSKELIYGAENLSAVINNLKAKKSFKVVAFGDSVTAGAQSFRSTWALNKNKKASDFLYFSHLARLMRDEYGYKEIKAVQYGHGGWTTAQGIGIADKEVIKEAGQEDLVIIQFGGNDLMGRTSIAAWKADEKKLIAKVKTKTKNILVMGITYGAGIERYSDEITKALKEIVSEERVAAFDDTKLSLYRGVKYAYSLNANQFHPDYVGHITIGELMLPAFTGKQVTYPE